MAQVKTDTLAPNPNPGEDDGEKNGKKGSAYDPGPPKGKLTETEQKQLRELAGKGLSREELSAELGVGTGTIERWAKRLGITIGKKGNGEKQPPLPGTEQAGAATTTAPEGPEVVPGTSGASPQPVAPPEAPKRRGRPPRAAVASALSERQANDYVALGFLVHAAIAANVTLEQYIETARRGIEVYDRIARDGAHEQGG